MPGDGAADPVGVTNMLAKASRLEGAKIFLPHFSKLLLGWLWELLQENIRI